MTEEEKKIKKMSNEEKVETLAKFVALRCCNLKNASLYGFMLDSLLDEINKRQRKIQKQQEELEKKDKMIDLMLGRIDPYRLPIEEKTTKCAKQYFKKQAKEV